MASKKGFGGGNTPFKSKTKKVSASSTGLVGSNGKSVAVPKVTAQPVNINKAVSSGGLTTKSTGLVNSKGQPVAVPRISTGRGSSVNTKGAIDSGGLVLGASISMPQGSSLRSSSFGGSTTGSGLASNTPNIPSSNVIDTLTLGAANTKLAFSEQTVQDHSQLIPTAQEQVVQDATKEKDGALQDLLRSMAEPPSSADAYKKAQKETGILKKQQEVNDLTGTLNGIVAKGEANQLSLVGQGRGIPEAIIGGQQAQIARETAIAALPVQAQLEAARGNLEMANDNLDTLFKIYSDDARNEYEYKKEVKKMVYESASEKEKRALDKLDKQEERSYQETQDLNDERLVYSKMAIANGQSSLGAKIAKLDYKSPTFKQDLAMLQEQLKDPTLDLDIALKQAQLIEAQNANNGTTINPKILATSQFKSAQAAQNLKLTLEKAKAAVLKYGNYEKMSATGKGVLDSIKVQLRSEISTALEQGVVVPGEAAAFDKIAGQLNSSFLFVPNVRNNTTLASLDSLSSSMDGRIALQKSALTNTYQIAPEDVDTLLNITDLTDQEFADMDALIN